MVHKPRLGDERNVEERSVGGARRRHPHGPVLGGKQAATIVVVGHTVACSRSLLMSARGKKQAPTRAGMMAAGQEADIRISTFIHLALLQLPDWLIACLLACLLD